MADIDANTQVSHEQDGRVLSGVGVPAERLAETMDRHTPEPEAPSGTVAAPTTTEGGSPAPALSRGRQRYSDLTRERDEAKAEAAAAKAERETLARERDEYRQRSQQPAQQPQQQQPQAPQQPQYTRPRPHIDEIGVKYETYEDFTLDQTIWANEQWTAQQQGGYEQQVRQVIAQERQQQQFVSSVNETQQRGRKAYADFDQLLASPAGSVPLGPTPQEALQRAAFVIHHPASEHIQYAILKTPGLAQWLQQADPVRFGMQIAALVPQQQPSRPAWTPPPAPHPSVGASSPTTTTPSGELAAKGGYDFDSSGYREKRAAERGTKSRFGR